MAETPAGPISLPVGHLRTLLSQSATFQSWVGAAGATAALARIYVEGVAEPSGTDTWTDIRPFAVVSNLRPLNWQRTKIAERGYRDGGALFLALERDVPSGDADSYADAEIGFMNTVGAILDEMWALSGTAGYLNLVAVTVLSGPHRANDDELDTQGDYQKIELQMAWSAA